MDIGQPALQDDEVTHGSFFLAISSVVTIIHHLNLLLNSG